MRAKTQVTAGADFSSYRTYRWLTDEKPLITLGHGDKFIRSGDNEARIRAAVERGLEARGLAKADGEPASLVVAFTVGTRVDYALGEGSAYEAVEDEPPNSASRARLRLYVFDAATKKMIWEAWATRGINGQKDLDAEVNHAVDLLLAKFPAPR
jgi:hypothetical protein